MTGGQRLEIVGPLSGSGAVHRPTGIEDVLKMSGFGNVLRTLKHHVFEEMSETRAAFFFVARANVVVDSYGDNGNGMVFAENYAKTIGKSELFDGGRCKLETIGHFNLDSSGFVGRGNPIVGVSIQNWAVDKVSLGWSLFNHAAQLSA